MKKLVKKNFAVNDSIEAYNSCGCWCYSCTCNCFGGPTVGTQNARGFEYVHGNVSASNYQK